MNAKRAFLVATIGALLVTPVMADWDPGDPFKMHYPQLPDPQGIDVSFRSPEVLADDWECTETGPVSDIHFWFSALDDAEPVIFNVHVSIHANIPPTPPIPYSMPGALLWERDFSPTEVSWRLAGTGQQGWYVPENGFYEPADHFRYYQMNIMNFVDPFIQQQGEIYWLDLSISAQTPLGWKSSMSPQFMDTSVWGILPNPAWQPVFDPRVPGAAFPLDLAFVITPEPGTLSVLALGALVLLRRR